MVERFYLVAEAAKFLNVHPHAIVRATNEGRCAVAARTAGGVRLLRIDDLQRYAARIRRRTTRTA